jgi:chitodextrinase
MSPRALPLALIRACAALALAAGPLRAQVTETSIALAWTAPGDDSLSGQATRYDLRWSLAPISTLADFANATPIAGVPAPQVAGSQESFTVTGLTPATTYWFALRTQDESGNISDLSNIVSGATLPSTDVERPAPLTLSLVGVTNTSVTVSWTDSGDDSLTGNATATEIRWATSAITEANWDAANAVLGVPAPGAPGTARQMTIGGLDRSDDLWFAARARDDVNRESAVTSSLFVQHLLDTAPPATPSGLHGTVEAVRDVRLRWTANAEPDLAGYHVYRALTSGGTMVRLTSSPISANEYLDNGTPDSVAVWYSVSALDGTGNESARTAPHRVYLVGGGISAWNLATPYPNPSPVGGGVTLPIEVPAAGPYDATLEIQDSAGQRVRTLTVRGAPPGPMTLVWDGRNEAGRATAPGVYRVWLRAGDTRKLTRILRTP